MTRRDKSVNFLIFLADAVGFPLGVAFFSTATIFPPLLTRLGATESTIGALAGVLSLVTFVPGLFVVRALARRTHIRPWLFTVALIERLVLLPLAFLVPLWGREHPSWAIAAIFVGVAGHGVSMGFNMPAYWMAVGKCVPAHWRGRLYGFAGGVAGLMTLWTDRVLHTSVLGGPEQGFPDGYGRGFLLGFVLLTASIVPFLWTREPPSKPTQAASGPILDIVALRRLWRDDAPFRRYVRGQAFFTLTAMGAPFFALYAQQRFGAGADLARYTSATLFSGAIGALVFGWLADRVGNRPIVAVSVACGLLAALLALLAPTGGVFVGVFALTALAAAGIDLAGNNLVMEMAGSPERIGIYSSFYNIVRALPRAIAPVLGGWIARQWGYPPIFWLCAALALAALALTPSKRSGR